MIYGISGFAGSGKDQLAKYMAPFGATNVALADPLKRIARDVYAFTDEQLWGPSGERNKPDPRYPREHSWKVIKDEDDLETGWQCACCGADRPVGQPPSVAQCFLTPRYVLQLLGTEFGRHCYGDTWASLCVRTAKELLGHHLLRYDPKRGVWREPTQRSSDDDERLEREATKIVTISDVRFWNEIRVIREAGGKLVRVRRPGAGLKGSAGLHPSEAEQAGIPDSWFDFVIDNTGTLDDLKAEAQRVIQALLR